MTPEAFRFAVCDRFTAEELVEMLGLTAEQIFDAFEDQCHKLDPEDVLF
jgi:hypothetical protein